MPAPNCSTVKTALTELKEILSRNQQSNHTVSGGGDVFAAIAGLEETINSIEEKSFAQGDFTADMGVPIITGLTQPLIS